MVRLGEYIKSKVHLCTILCGIRSESAEDPSSRSISSLDTDAELSHSCDIVFDMELSK
jgi:hypothetical protein